MHPWRSRTDLIDESDRPTDSGSWLQYGGKSYGNLNTMAASWWRRQAARNFFYWCDLVEF